MHSKSYSVFKSSLQYKLNILTSYHQKQKKSLNTQYRFNYNFGQVWSLRTLFWPFHFSHSGHAACIVYSAVPIKRLHSEWFCWACWHPLHAWPAVLGGIFFLSCLEYYRHLGHVTLCTVCQCVCVCVYGGACIPAQISIK